ncbi:MAG: hypothetical protein Q8K60_08235 [Parachlamydiaceae bacterium]|nr:hypothetical protein [Parachlamydiaceae bacterium]
MSLKFLVNKVNFTGFEKVISPFRQKIQNHKYFVHGVITVTNAVTFPIANYLSNLISKSFCSHTERKYYVYDDNDESIKEEKKVILVNFTFTSKLINFTSFGSILFLVNAFVTSKLLKKNHMKLAILGSFGLSLYRHINQISTNNADNLRKMGVFYEAFAEDYQNTIAAYDESFSEIEEKIKEYEDKFNKYDGFFKELFSNNQNLQSLDSSI